MTSIAVLLGVLSVVLLGMAVYGLAKWREECALREAAENLYRAEQQIAYDMGKALREMREQQRRQFAESTIAEIRYAEADTRARLEEESNDALARHGDAVADRIMGGLSLPDLAAVSAAASSGGKRPGPARG